MSITFTAVFRVCAFQESMIVPALSAVSGPSLIFEMQRQWNNHLVLTRWMKYLFSSLRANSHMRSVELPSLTSQSCEIFMDKVLERVKRQVAEEAVNMVSMELGGEDIDRYAALA